MIQRLTFLFRFLNWKNLIIIEIIVMHLPDLYTVKPLSSELPTIFNAGYSNRINFRKKKTQITQR